MKSRIYHTYDRWYGDCQRDGMGIRKLALLSRRVSVLVVIAFDRLVINLADVASQPLVWSAKQGS